MDELQARFNLAMEALREAHEQEAPSWEELCRLGSDPRAPFTPDLADRWFEKRLATEARYRDVKSAVDDITKAGGIPSIGG